MNNDQEYEEDEFTTMCPRHGEQLASYVCKHLLYMTGRNYVVPNQEDDPVNAWCLDCEIFRQAQGGWTDEASEFAQLQVVCEVCFHRLLAGNLERLQ